MDEITTEELMEGHIELIKYYITLTKVRDKLENRTNTKAD